MHDSLFMNNQGSVGGTFYLTYAAGSVRFFSNIFLNNSLPLDGSSGGASITSNLGVFSLVKLSNNSFILNIASACNFLF